MSKTTPQRIIEKDSITIIRNKLASNLFEYKFSEDDKEPDIDGHLRIIDERGNILPKIVLIQIKGTKSLKYHCAKKVVEFASKVNTAFLLLIVNVESKKLFWHKPERKGDIKGYTIDLIGSAYEITDGGKALHKVLDDELHAEQNLFNAPSPSVQSKPLGATGDSNLKGKIKTIVEFLDRNLIILSREDIITKLEEFKKIETDYSKYCYLLYLGNLETYYGNNKKAKIAYKKAIQSYDKSIVAVTNLALIHCLDSKPNKAIILLKKYEAQSKKFALFWNALGIAYMTRRDLEGCLDDLFKAKESYKKALKINSKDSNIAFNFLACLRNLNDHEKYEEWKNKCEREYSDDPLIINELAIEEFEQYYKTLDKKHLHKMGEWLTSKVNEYIEFRIDDTPELKISISVYNRQAYQPVLDNAANYFFQIGEEQKAEKIWNLLIQDDDSYKSAHQNLAVYYAYRHDFEKALNHIKKAQGSKRFSYQFFGGMLLDAFLLTPARKGFWNISFVKEAREAFKRAAEQTGDISMIANEAACICLLGQIDKALQLVSIAKEKNPDNYFLNLKSIQIRLSRKLEIIDCLNEMEKLSEKFPQEYDHLFQIAYLYEKRTGEDEKAKKTYNIALEKLLKHPNRVQDMRVPSLVLQTVDFFVGKGDRFRAIQILENCINQLKFVERLKGAKTRLIEMQ